ncbi:KGK domain-containing protein [Limnoraphis robusta]|uniref:KGK domain protein n=1 Tax=Limnoraphis robusta CS-951 TaxID=1637645 RepID=A0A0F5YDB6_9CYAN|nr:KGK domain-containing protein [Limnoraphis robusta]KKD36904.1 hypothetical protein WN50_17165 [Limnoraphis robusta CS-951]
MESIFNDGFQPLTCDQDVLLFGKDTFTVGQFKELVLRQVNNKVYYSVSGYSESRYSNSRHYLIIQQLNEAYSVENKVEIPISENYWVSCSGNIECQLLKIGSIGWKNGKLRIRTKVTFFPDEYIGKSYNHVQQWDYLKTEIQVELEFSPDEPNEYQSPLDKLRQLESDLQKE